MPEPTTTNGNLNQLKVTDKNGNVSVLLPVDTEARQEIESAELIQFDDSFFTAEEDRVNGEVNIGLNGVPIGVDETLQFVQDNAEGIVLGVNTTVEGNRITEIGGTPVGADVSGKQDALPQSSANQFLQTDANNNITWGNAPAQEKNYSYVYDDNPAEVNGMFRISVGRDQAGYSGAPRYIYQNGSDRKLGYLLPPPAYNANNRIPCTYTDAGNNLTYCLKSASELGIANTIESISLNGTAISPDNNKNVNLSIIGIPSSTVSDADKVLTVNSAGSPEWKSPRIPVISSSAGDDTLSGTTLTSVVHPNTYKEITVADTVTKLVVQIEEAVVGILQQTGFQFTLGANSVLTNFEVQRGAYLLPVIGMTTFVPGQTYQGSIVNGLVTLAEFGTPEIGPFSIGGRDYQVAKIGNLLWTTENLDYAWSGLALNPSSISGSTQGAWYNDRELYGLCYNHNAVIHLQSELTNGWRIPTPDDYYTLITYSVSDLKSTSGWSTSGTNTSGFNAKPSGYYSTGWHEVGTAFRAESWNETYKYTFLISSSAKDMQRYVLSFSPDVGFPLRLVRDAT